MKTPQPILNRIWKIKNGGTFSTTDKIKATDLVLYGKDHELEFVIEENNNKYVVKMKEGK